MCKRFPVQNLTNIAPFAPNRSAGFPVLDVEVELFDGGFHAVDSSAIAFEIAGGRRTLGQNVWDVLWAMV